MIFLKHSKWLKTYRIWKFFFAPKYEQIRFIAFFIRNLRLLRRYLLWYYDDKYFENFEDWKNTNLIPKPRKKVNFNNIESIGTVLNLKTASLWCIIENETDAPLLYSSNLSDKRNEQDFLIKIFNNLRRNSKKISRAKLTKCTHVVFYVSILLFSGSLKFGLALSRFSRMQLTSVKSKSKFCLDLFCLLSWLRFVLWIAAGAMKMIKRQVAKPP